MATAPSYLSPSGGSVLSKWQSSVIAATTALTSWSFTASLNRSTASSAACWVVMVLSQGVGQEGREPGRIDEHGRCPAEEETAKPLRSPRGRRDRSSRRPSVRFRVAI